MRVRAGWRALGATVCALALAMGAGAGTAAAAPPAGCTPTAIPALVSGAASCVSGVLVTSTDNAQEQNHTSFSVTDHVSTLAATVPNWWPSGPPTAGMVVTLWGTLSGGVFKVTRWVDTSHGSGPAPDGPYPRVRALDVSAGRIPEHRMVWVAASAFLLDPQNGGDGDIHVQTNTDCPAAGLTTENTPPLRGYVDHPAVPGMTGTTDTTDAPSNHLADAPPVGVPVMILGATRYDYGFGWWEIHPIRAWRFLTPAEYSQMAADCAADPTPHLDPTGVAPAPYGVPPCTDGSEVGNPLSTFGSCGPRCYVSHTAIGQPETLSGPCTGIAATVTPSQEGVVSSASQTPPGPPVNPPDDRQHVGSGSGSGSGSAGGGGGGGAAAGPRSTVTPATQAALARTYGALCRPLHRGRRGAARHAFRVCVQAMARLAGGESLTVARVCSTESRRLPRRGAGSYRAMCLRVGARLRAELARARVVERD